MAKSFVGFLIADLPLGFWFWSQPTFVQNNVLSIVTCFSFPRVISFWEAQFSWVFVFASVRTISESSSLGEVGERSSIICPLCVCRSILMEMRRGSVLSRCGESDCHGVKLGLSLPAQHLDFQIFLSFAQS